MRGDIEGSCFIVRDNNGQALAYVYFEGEPGHDRVAGLVTGMRSDGSRPPLKPKLVDWRMHGGRNRRDAYILSVGCRGP